MVNNTGNVWINGASSNLTVSGAVLAANQLTASAAGNTVNYNGSGARTIVSPTSSQYVNLQATTSGTKTLAADVDVDGILTINGTATFDPATSDVTLAGNLVNNGSMTVGTGASLLTFDGTTTISGSGTTKLHDVTISGTLTGHSTGFNVDGNWVNNGTFTHNSGTVTFDGTSTISGSSTTSFDGVSIAGSSTLTGASAANFNVAGDFTNAGTYTHNSGTVTFNGSSAQNITGGVATTFNNLTNRAIRYPRPQAQPLPTRLSSGAWGG